MAELAEVIEVRAVLTGANRRYSIRINGEEFPWFTEGGVSTNVTTDGMPSVTVTIPAQWIDIEHRIE